MPEVIMTIKNGNATMSINAFGDFEDYRPWLDDFKWSRLTKDEQIEHYHKRQAQHMKRLGTVVKSFMKECQK